MSKRKRHRHPAKTVATAPITMQEILPKLFLYSALGICVSIVASYLIVAVVPEFHSFFLQHFLLVFGLLMLVSTGLSFMAGQSLRNQNEGLLVMQIYYLFNIAWFGFSLSFGYYYVDTLVLLSAFGAIMCYFMALVALAKQVSPDLLDFYFPLGLSLGVFLLTQVGMLLWGRFSWSSLFLCAFSLILCSIFTIVIVYSVKSEVAEITGKGSGQDIEKIILWTSVPMFEMFAVIFRMIGEIFERSKKQ